MSNNKQRPKQGGKQGGKGRPTPKRSEAQKKRRGPVAPPPQTRKEAIRRSREEAAAKRAEVRRAIREGDETAYPAIHRGPERQAVRDAVDSRAAIASFVFAMWALGFVLSLVPSVAARSLGGLMVFSVLGLLISDALGAHRAIRKALKDKFPNGTKESRGRLVRYGLARNASFRRTRVPPPRTSRTGPVA